MEFTVRTTHPDRQRTACAAVGVSEDRKLSPSARIIDGLSGGAISKAMRRGDMNGRIGRSLVLHGLPGVAAERVLVVGCGPPKSMDDAHYRKINAHAMDALKSTGAKDVVSYLGELDVADRSTYWKVREAVAVAYERSYRFDRFKRVGADDAVAVKRVVFHVAGARDEHDAGRRGVEHGKALAGGIALAKDLGNLPPNECTPTYLAEQARKLCEGQRLVKTRVLGDAEMKRHAMGALLAVAKGSREPAKLIVVEYRGGKQAGRPVVLVGKGVTFDSGGISIKPAAAMDEMKFDMCGAASVLGTLRAAIDLKLPANLIGLIPATENLPDGNASKPGDIVTTMSGLTVEILNTDAEGRLILCDALTYAGRYQPDAVIDIATLTGACVVALGGHAAGLFSNHPPLARELLDAGEIAGDRAWEMPIWEDYQEQLKSNFADMANVGGREAGAVTAACFLSRFTKEYHWAHLDIAGVAWNSGPKKGSTGRPVGLLVQYLLSRFAETG
jgi:leucyl aminopeptidase